MRACIALILLLFGTLATAGQTLPYHADPGARDAVPNLAAVPTIRFLTGNPALLALQAEAGGSIIGLDWRCDLAEARRLLGPQRAVQGNLDPVTLMADPAVLKQRAEAVLSSGACSSEPGVSAPRAPGHIFNLGHGVLPGTPVENVKRLVEWVHAW